jgi:hypothetical protein
MQKAAADALNALLKSSLANALEKLQVQQRHVNLPALTYLHRIQVYFDF